MDVKRKFFTQRHWNRLPKEAVDAPSLQASKARLDVALGSLGCWLVTLHIAGGWNWMSTVGLCNPGHSMMILCWVIIEREGSRGTACSMLHSVW